MRPLPNLLLSPLVLLLLAGLAAAAPVEREGLDGKVLAGYQGWFTADGDGTGFAWVHWGHNGTFEPGTCTIDLWPNVSEYEHTYPTAFRHSDGRVARVFSSADASTVDTHFRWMAEYGIDGAFLQRFGSDLRDPKLAAVRTRVLDHVRNAAATHGRVWVPMYDLSGLSGEEVRALADDWAMLVDSDRVRDDRHLTLEGRPLVAIWGLGFNDGRQYGAADVRALVEFLKLDPKYGGNAIMLGVPYGWRTGDGDMIADPAALAVIKKLADVVSPWTVGRYAAPDDMHRHRRTRLEPDLDWCDQRGKAYLPVIWPGFRWRNLQAATGGDPAPIIERRGGHFLWSQALAARQAGANAVYVAMFDEVDEATAIFKIDNDPPTGESEFGTNAPAAGDAMLWLTGEINRLLFRDAGDGGNHFPSDMPERQDP